MTDPFSRNVYCILGLPLDAIDLIEATNRIVWSASNRARCFLSTPNLNWIVACQRDSFLRQSVIDSDLSVADGMPLVWVARCLGIPVKERVAGSAIFESLRCRSEKKISVFFFGGPEGIAEAACKRLNQEFGGITCVGYANPGFGSVSDMSTPEIIDSINASGADFVVVSLGAKKGQAWIEQNRGALLAPVLSHLGAVVNFVAGTVSRAPVWMQRSGLEWLWRIKEEKKLWRRYAVDGMVFVRLFLTRVVPYRLFLRSNRPSLHKLASASIEIRDTHIGTEIVLRGFFSEGNLTLVRQSFAQGARSRKHISVDLSAVSYVDSAFVGLLLVLAGESRRQGASLVVTGVSSNIRRILRYCCVEYLLTE